MSETQQAYARAFVRAQQKRVVAYKTSPTTYQVPSTSEDGLVHTVRVVGPRWHDLSCSCKGAGHRACVHRAVAAFARQYHVSAVRKTA